MSRLEASLLDYLLNSLWLIPLLFAAACIAARALRWSGPRAQHRIWVGALLLQVLLPSASVSPLLWLRALWSSRAGLPAGVRVTVVGGPGVATGLLHLPAHLLSAITLLYAGVTLYLLARLLWRASSLAAMRRRSHPLALTGDAAIFWSRCSRTFRVPRASLAASSEIFGPVTLGIRRQLVLLPSAMVRRLAPEDLRTVIAHEFAHMHRHDFAKNLLYEILSLPLSYHPLLWLTRARVNETREMVCDHLAADLSGRPQYAHSLLRLARLLLTETSTSNPHAIGILDANTLERRLMKLTQPLPQVRTMQRLATVAACLALGIATCCSALALHLHVGASHSDTKAASAPVKVDSGTAAGTILTQVHPVYPEAAKKARIQGPVVLHAIIGKEGAVESLSVLSGPEELRRSTLDAVRQWTYKPFLINGDPTAVETTITVTYTLEP